MQHPDEEKDCRHENDDYADCGRIAWAASSVWLAIADVSRRCMAFIKAAVSLQAANNLRRKQAPSMISSH